MPTVALIIGCTGCSIDGGAGRWVTCIGHCVGTFRAPLSGIPACGEPVWLRFGEFCRVAGGRIAEARILLNLVDLARQAGCPVLPPSPCRDILVPGPPAQDGLQPGATDPALGQQSFDLVMAMIGGLGRYNQSDLKSMGMARYWHPDRIWYGRCDIGTTHSIAGFEQHHQSRFSPLCLTAKVATTGCAWPTGRMGSPLAGPAASA